MANDMIFTLKLDMSGFTGGIKEALENISKIPNPIEVKPEITKETSDKLFSSITEITFALNNMVAMARNIGQAFNEYISASNIQEKAVAALTSALRVNGETADYVIEDYKRLATQIQKTTTVGDEQVLQLTKMAVNMGIANNKREQAIKGAIGLSKAIGIDLNTAMKGIALAYEGEYSQLNRYIPALRSAQDDTEKMTILTNLMQQGFQQAKDETQTTAGAIEQYNNMVGDLKESIGDMIKGVLIYFVKVLREIVDVLNKNKVLLGIIATAFVTYATAISRAVFAKAALLLNTGALTLAQWANVAVTGIAKITTGALTTAQIAYNTALTATIIKMSALTLGLSLLVYGITKAIVAQNELTKATEDYEKIKIRISQANWSTWGESRGKIEEGIALLREQVAAGLSTYDKLEERVKNYVFSVKNYYGESSEEYKKVCLLQISIEEEKADKIAQIQKMQDRQNPYAETEARYKQDLALLEEYHKQGAVTEAQYQQTKATLASEYNQKVKDLKLAELREEIDIAKRKVALGLQTTEQLQRQQDDYHRWVFDNYKENSDAWLRVIQEMQDAQKALEDAERQAEATRLQARADEKQSLEEAIALAEKRVQVTGDGYHKLTQAADAYYNWVAAREDATEMEYLEALDKKQQAHAAAIENMKSKIPSFQETWLQAMERIKQACGEFGELATGVLETIQGNMNGMLSQLVNKTKSFKQVMDDLWKSMITTMLNELNKLIVRWIFFKTLQIGTNPFAAVVGHASGGYITRPGTPTSDSIPARLSNGEYVINAAKTRLFKPLLDVINYSPVPAIKKMFNDYAATIHLPLTTFNLPLATPRYAYATGGYVNGVPASDFTAMTARLDQVINSVEHLTTQMTNQMERLNQKDYNVNVTTKFKGVEFAREINNAQAEYKQTGLNG